jgi:hypothetical protein
MIRRKKLERESAAWRGRKSGVPHSQEFIHVGDEGKINGKMLLDQVIFKADTFGMKNQAPIFRNAMNLRCCAPTNV